MPILYVVGFVFTPDQQQVALIRKARPKWQAGRLNGIGGKIDPGETALDAMVREFEEETGVRIEAGDWSSQIRLSADTWEVYFFSACSERVQDIRSTTDEEVGLYRVDRLYMEETLNNLRWLVPLVLDPDILKPIRLSE